MPSNFLIVQFSMIVLLMITFTIASNIPQPASFIAELTHKYDDEVKTKDLFRRKNKYLLIFVFVAKSSGGFPRSS